MAVDTPATIAILGAGPIGLEAALYARFLGYDVRVFERGRVAENVQRWAHVKMFTPMSMNTSSLGRAALFAQQHSIEDLLTENCPTGAEWVAKYLLPLAQSDLLVDSIVENTDVVSVTRWDLWKGEKLDDEERGDSMFRVFVRDSGGNERAETADVVIDTTGVYAHPNWLGPGGGPALGEISLRHRIDYTLPDVLGQDRDRFQSKRTLLVGSGYSAATTAVAIATLAAETGDTRALWLTHRGDRSEVLIPRIENDRLANRDELARRANEIANGGNERIEHRSDWAVVSIEAKGDQFQVRLQNIETDEQVTEIVDHIVANVGYHVDSSIFRELHVHQCYATEGPMRLASSLMKEENAAGDCLEQKFGGVQSLVTPEPHFYILGAKSFGRRSNFLFSLGLQQIRDLFTLIGDRENLDLYAGARNLPQ